MPPREISEMSIPLEPGERLSRGLAGARHPRAVDMSVVLPFRNERDNLPELLDRLEATLGGMRVRYELIFVDDGSADNGAMVVEKRARIDERIKLLVLSRNFGQHIAGSAGIDVACGEMVVWMDSDLQERPEDIPRLVAKHREGFDVVYARRARREQTAWRAIVSQTFLTILNRLVGLDVSANRACLRLLSQNVARSLSQCRERNRYMACLIPWLGYRSAEIKIEVDPRRHGKTNYSLTRLLRHALAGITSFSVAPLRISAMLSLGTILACIAGVGWVLYKYLVWGIAASGWASLIIVMLALHALEFAVLATLGEYVGLTYAEAKRRPLYLCDRVVNLSRAGDPGLTDASLGRLNPAVPGPGGTSENRVCT